MAEGWGIGGIKGEERIEGDSDLRRLVCEGRMSVCDGRRSVCEWRMSVCEGRRWYITLFLSLAVNKRTSI